MSVEDDGAPFDTSISVEFKTRAAKSDFEEFDPSNLPTLASNEQTQNRTRVVRIGMRRVRVRNPPVVMEVAFSRLGVGYGLRQWRRAYRVRSWSLFQVTGGVFVPLSDVRVESHVLVEPGLAAGNITDYAVITSVKSPKRVFAYASLFVPKWRDARDRSQGWAQRLAWAAPELVLGWGFPPKRKQQIYYTGLGWSIIPDRLGFTAGMLWARESRLLPGKRVGEQLENKTAPHSDYAKYRIVGTITVGLTVDLNGIRSGF